MAGKLKPEEAVQATLSSLPDEVVDTVGVTALSSEDSVSERKRKLEYLEMQEELIKVFLFVCFPCDSAYRGAWNFPCIYELAEILQETVVLLWIQLNVGGGRRRRGGNGKDERVCFESKRCSFG